MFLQNKKSNLLPSYYSSAYKSSVANLGCNSHSVERENVQKVGSPLKSIKTSGSATLTGENQLVAEKISIVTTDAGDITNLSLTAKQLSVQINDSANANLVVQVEKSNIEMNDAGDLDISGVAYQQQLRSHGSRGTLNNSQLKYN